MFDQLKAKHHSCFMDNLYLSALFCKRSQNSDNAVKLHGVTRGELRGIPKCIVQTELQNKDLQCAVRGTVKAAVLLGDPDINGLVAWSIYDSKLTYFLSTVMESIKWDINKKNVFNPATFQMYMTQFLRLNWQNIYNMEMDHTDEADQLADRCTPNGPYTESMESIHRYEHLGY